MSQSRQSAGSGGAGRGTSDVAYNLISVSYHALQGAETTGIYANDAEQDGSAELAKFFRAVQGDYLKRAEEAKQLLKREL
jgi:hypothetical protein